jgi:hypothetical protein
MASNNTPTASGVKTADISRVQPDAPEPDARARQEAALYDHQYRTQQAELGWIGKLIGCNAEKPGNISFITIILSLIIIVVSVCAGSAHFEKVLTVFISVITLALGYLFGSNKKSD